MNQKTVAMGLAFIGVFFFLAIAFDILTKNVGTFGGVVFFMLSGFAWAFWPKKENEPKK
jgi:hypothetical protein